MPRALTLPPLDAATLSEVRRRYDDAPDPDTRSRYQMILLIQRGYTAPEIAAIVRRGADTVRRVLRRFLAGGPGAVPRRYAPGGPRTVTPAWEAELLRAIDLDPHAVGVEGATWTTGLLAAYLARATGIAVDPETVRLHLHAHDYVCKRYPRAGTHLDAQEESRGAAGVGGKRLRVEALLAGAAAPAPPPLADLVEPDLWDQLPPDLPALLDLVPRADLYLQDEVQIAFHPTLTRVWCPKGRRGQRLVAAPGDNRKAYGFGLVDWRDGWFDGRIAPQRTAGPFCDQVRAGAERSRGRGRVAIVLADNLRVHTARGSRLVREMLADLEGQLVLLYTPPYDPEANRIEWLWRVVRHAVTHNHHREDFAALLDDLAAHFARLLRDPAAVLQHLGSPGPPPDHPAHEHPLAA